LFARSSYSYFCAFHRAALDSKRNITFTYVKSNKNATLAPSVEPSTSIQTSTQAPDWVDILKVAVVFNARSWFSNEDLRAEVCDKVATVLEGMVDYCKLDVPSQRRRRLSNFLPYTAHIDILVDDVRSREREVDEDTFADRIPVDADMDITAIMTSDKFLSNIKNIAKTYALDMLHSAVIFRA